MGDLIKDICWQWWGAKSTALSVCHLHCYVMTLQTSGVHFMFWSIQFSTGRNYQSTRRAAVAWRLVRGVCDCKVASLTPQTIWEYDMEEVNEKHSLLPSTTAAEVPICKTASFQMIQWQSSGNTGQLPLMTLCVRVCAEAPRLIG